MATKKIKDWVLILNPHAGSGKGAKDQEKILKLLRKYNFEIELHISEYPKHAISITKQLIESGWRKIIIAGGDGSLNEIVNGIFSQNVADPREILVGMIPVGTGNDWIKTFGIPNDYKKAIKRIIKEKTFVQDVGKITYKSDQELTRYFANMAGFGFDALVAEKANRLKDKGRTGIMVYLQSLVSAFIQYRISKTKIKIDQQEIEDYVFTSSIGIGKFNGGGMMQAPDAIPNNGLFQVTVIRKIGIWGILTNLSGLYSGKYINDRRVSTYFAKRVEITSEKSIAGEADGEILGNHSFLIEIVPQQLRIVRGKKLKFVSE